MNLAEWVRVYAVSFLGRVCSFLLNVCIAHQWGEKGMYAHTIFVPWLYSTLTFVYKETMRQVKPSLSDQRILMQINMGIAGVLLLFLSLLTDTVPWIAVGVLCTGCFIELLADPDISNLPIEQRLQIEAQCNMVRLLMLGGASFFLQSTYAMTTMAIAQCVYGVCCVAWTQKRRSTPIVVTQSRHLDVVRVYLMNVLRYLLVDMDKIALMAMNVTVSTSASWGMATAMGSLLIRVVFLPLEQVAFYKFVHASSTEQKRHELVSSLMLVATIYLVFVAVFAMVYDQMIPLLYGYHWKNEDLSLVALYVYTYVPLCAINGILDAFCRTRTRHSYMVSLVALTCLHVVVVVMGASYDNDHMLWMIGFSMSCRICFSVCSIAFDF